MSPCSGIVLRTNAMVPDPRQDADRIDRPVLPRRLADRLCSRRFNVTPFGSRCRQSGHRIGRSRSSGLVGNGVTLGVFAVRRRTTTIFANVGSGISTPLHRSHTSMASRSLRIARVSAIRRSGSRAGAHRSGARRRGPARGTRRCRSASTPSTAARDGAHWGATVGTVHRPRILPCFGWDTELPCRRKTRPVWK